MIAFTKLHGIGNDYLHVDATRRPVADPGSLAIAMSNRHTGVGADGLILVLPAEPETGAHLRMRMFNADGSEAEMCGNGIRCLCKFARERGLCDANPMRVHTGAGVLTLRYELTHGRVDRVTVDMGPARLRPDEIPIALPPDGETRDRVVNLPLAGHLALDEPWVAASGLDPRLTCVSMGNPHAVIFCARTDAVPLETFGPGLERHAMFPSRVNVHVVRVIGPDEVEMRTWERGSGITRACGTGAAAVCVAGALTGRTGDRIVAHLPGGDLDLSRDAATGHVFMTGPAVEVFSGEWDGGRDGARERRSDEGQE